ncbi:MAG: hypothetical protein J6Q80_03755 [Lentisphaeria bacterium]|nr:hypothetical protein [Lentisphaeria bacterium]
MILSFNAGTLLLTQVERELPEEVKNFFTFDSRSGCHTARGCDYAGIVIALLKNGVQFTDTAKDYSQLTNIKLKK